MAKNKHEKQQQEEKKKDERARDQAIAQMESIKNMVARLEHVRDCDGGGDCELADNDLCDGLGLFLEPLPAKEREKYKEEYHDEDAARQAISEDPLSIEVRSGWLSPSEFSSSRIEPEEFTILLCTGGPAVRLIGELDEHNQPKDVRIEYQDWFTPWEELVLDHEGYEIIEKYAAQFEFSY